MAIERKYQLEVVAKWEGTHGFGQITLRPPSINGEDIDINRPWWIDKTTQGVPASMGLRPEEMAEVEIGTLFEITIKETHA